MKFSYFSSHNQEFDPYVCLSLKKKEKGKPFKETQTLGQPS